MNSKDPMKVSRRRTFSLEDPRQQKCEDGSLGLRKSLSSTLKIPMFASGISNCDLTTQEGEKFDSLEDLNKEIENLCPFNLTLLPHQQKVANSRYCDIFSRQSMESDDHSSPDDDERVKFQATISKSGCEVVQLVPKKLTASTDQNVMYQPSTNTIIQLKQSTFSAFRDMSEIKASRSNPLECDVGGEGTIAAASAVSSQISSHDEQP